MEGQFLSNCVKIIRNIAIILLINSLKLFIITQLSHLEKRESLDLTGEFGQNAKNTQSFGKMKLSKPTSTKERMFFMSIVPNSSASDQQLLSRVDRFSKNSGLALYSKSPIL
ncbi:hypothetical protein HUR95_00375 [Caldalkalibacillus thermarum TA2.A1]|uniref:Uncharacterized protein n=2 Tax=Caldalkalibacillus thermarum (strain TA2.A1) TaxID=986075 RepID=A0A8X8I978_CALTT|nr:hypothetical protein [Caldalkalibacillus thermarum]QZT33934.1 hypothetical protein HUR95_00375 [Caldalkalibacillus thermarum TA2.A1]